MFKAYDLIEVVETIHFVDGTSHVEGERMVVKSKELAYFNHADNSQFYKLVDRQQAGIDYPYNSDYEPHEC